ncbi:MAG: hypothetical protein SWH78_02580 [Thermodesulfobacteriota bacterium]|nr:hypothetical protein [Thermodesulfobacteriota bacterium]
MPISSNWKKHLSVLLLTLTVFVFVGGRTLLLADENDAPHQTHLTLARGPGLGTICTPCHTASPGIYENIRSPLAAACVTCHSPGGPFDGVNDSAVGAVNNWDNLGDPGDAADSLIYASFYPVDVKLKSGKEKWCATCHDQSAMGANVMEEFEGYADDAGLQSKWKGKQAARPVQLWSYVPDELGDYELGISGQFMRVKLKWDGSATYGLVKRNFAGSPEDPYLDLGGKDYFGFYMKVENKGKIKKLKVKLKLMGQLTWCTAKFKVDAASGFVNDVWHLVLLPRASFDNDACFDGLVDKMKLVILEGNPGAPPAVTSVYFDAFGCDFTGANVIGDNETYGYYKTGHKVNCTRCHDPSSKHIDGNRRHVFGYIKKNANPTNFRFYPDPAKQMQLPYTEYIPGAEGSFALCYGCHFEEKLMANEPAENLETNFTDVGFIADGAPDNLHLYHVGGERYPEISDLEAIVYHGTCVLCHDPHGLLNPAMARREMGNFIYFDQNGCEVAKEEWHNPDVNMGGAQTEGYATYEPLCSEVCHINGVPPNPDCQGTHPYINSMGMDGWYTRGYERVPHKPGTEFDLDCFFCHTAGPSHATHIQTNPKGPAPLACEDCHLINEETVFQMDRMVQLDVCNPCHSPDGAFDGLDDTEFGAINNWDNGVYDYESGGNSFRPGKEQWCVSCHDDGTSLCDGVSAPDVGIFYTGGHGRPGASVECLSCHDATRTHIDGEARTYAFDSPSYDPGLSGVTYASGYRLLYVGGNVPLMIPADVTITFDCTSQAIKDNAFKLCFNCHDSYKLFDNTPGDGLDTNFKPSLPDPPMGYSYAYGSEWDNNHRAHLLSFAGPYWDSDWDTGTIGGTGADGRESMITCSSCHNVHGAAAAQAGWTNEAMIRDGSLAGRTGYGFSYVVEDVASGGYPMVTSTGATQANSVGAVFRNNTDNMCGGSYCHDSPTSPPGSSYDATGIGWGTYLEYYRPWQDYLGN